MSCKISKQSWLGPDFKIAVKCCNYLKSLASLANPQGKSKQDRFTSCFNDLSRRLIFWRVGRGCKHFIYLFGREHGRELFLTDVVEMFLNA